jgi:hypothetical protein
MKKLLLFLIFLAFGISAYFYLPKTLLYQKVPPNLDKELRLKATKSYLETEIKNALKKNNIEDAQDFLNLANYLNIEINSTIKRQLQKKQQLLPKAIRNTKDFLSGFISGKSENKSELIGAIASDFTVVGDVRDIYTEGKKYLANENYNKITLYLSVIGLGLSGATIVSLGSAAPIKASASILKSANKSAKLTKNFSKVLTNKLEKSIDLKVLKQIDYSSLNSIKKGAKAFKNSINLKPISAILKDLQTIKKNSSTIETIKVLKYIESEQDLKKLVKISNKYKKNTKSVLKVLGKSAFRGAKIVVKKTTKYFLVLAGLIISIIGGLISFILLIKSLISPKRG